MLNKIITKLLLFFACLIFLSSFCKAQSGGYQEYTTSGMNGVGVYSLCALFNNEIMILVGEDGLVYRSTDNGHTGTQIPGGSLIHSINQEHINSGQLPGLIKSPGQKNDHEADVFTDSLWIAGNSGAIFFTSNSGANWVQQSSGITGNIYSIDFPDNHNGWAADLGGHIVHTTNAGANWTLQTTVGLTPYKIYFSDLLNGWVTGFGSIVKYTSNGGTTWIDRTPPGVDPLGYIWSIKFLNQNTGWMCGQNYGSYSLFRTTNGGAHWDSCYITPSPSIIWGISFVNALTGYACAPGAIFKTTNGGVSWVSQTLPPNTPVLYDIQFANADTGFAVGQNAEILYTTSGGDPIGIIPISGDVPKTFELYQNYPNPFNPATTIKFDLQKKSDVKLIIYDLTGRTIQTESKDKLNPGSYQYKWDASNYASGVYFYKLVADNFTETKKMILTK